MDFTFTNLLPKEKEPLMSSLVTDSANMATYSMNVDCGDTILYLDSSAYGPNKISRMLYAPSNDDLSAKDDGCRLVLGLGPTPTSYCSDHYTAGLSKTKESTSLRSQSWGSETDSEMLELGLSRGNEESVAMTKSNQDSSPPSLENWLLVQILDESSTSAKRNSGGYMPALLFAPRTENPRVSKSLPPTFELSDLGSNANANLSLHSMGTTDSSAEIILNSSIAGQRNHHSHPRKCMFNGCSKGARGASQLCIAHGGGQRCQKPGCNKGAESRTAFCKAHGGGRRCQMLGCTKSAEGKTDYCIAHGGGHRCSHPGCTKAARGRSGLCIKHGGGKRCKVEGCPRSAEGQAGLCISHGGGRRCQYPGCGKGAQGSTMYCKAHGGGKRCIFEGCTKGAEGCTPLCKGHGGGKRCLFEGGGVCPKSVHGGTNFCVAHGGGKRCAVPGCTKSARGRSDCCVRHGGGKRCKFEGCGKSAQGSTDFCKSHGGGKRCTWSSGCDKFARGRSGLCAAHASLMASQQAREARMSGSMIGPGLFRGIVSSSTTVGSSVDNENSSSVMTTGSEDCAVSSVNTGKRQLLIPPQVLVPMSMKSSTSSISVGAGEDDAIVIPEGRVHGGGLMSLLGGSFKNAGDGGSELVQMG